MMEVRVQAYDPAWAQAFEWEADLLRVLVGAEFIAAHHIGSTAVPGIVAKPIVDVLLEVHAIARLDLLGESMRGHGYQAMGEYGLPGRRYFRKHTHAGVRSHHVHAYEAGNPEIRRHLAFRDFLLAHPQIAREYSALKQQLALAHPSDMAAYVDGKAPFIRDVEAKALAWSRTLPSVPARRLSL
jgi:GrpB-like predicted nucleotidyltransferase (UPF0157 family)